jgi:hypothetical protein
MENSHEVSRGFDVILPDAAPEELRKWWDRVLLTARDLCNDPHGMLISSDVLIARKSEFRVKDVEKGKDCMRRAIEYHLKSMPNITGAVFMQLIRNLGSQNDI